MKLPWKISEKQIQNINDLQRKMIAEIESLHQEIEELKSETNRLSMIIRFQMENIESEFDFPEEGSNLLSQMTKNKIESYFLLAISLSFAAISAAGCVWLLTNLL